MVVVSIAAEAVAASAVVGSRVGVGFAVVVDSRVSVASVLVLSSEIVENIDSTPEVASVSVSIPMVEVDTVDRRIEVVGMAGPRVELVAGRGLQTLATPRLAARATMQKGVTARILKRKMKE